MFCAKKVTKLPDLTVPFKTMQYEHTVCTVTRQTPVKM
jgi:hypothetical protein